MPMKIKTLSTFDKSGKLQVTEAERRDLRTNDVQIRIQFCGICHSDLHTIRSDWPGTIYPCCPGHEIVGQVMHVGADVKKFKPGDRVGVGCMVDSCRDCDQCKRGFEQYCPKMVGTYNSKLPDGSITKGGYSTHIVVREEFVVRIPENLGMAAAAPLLCAGSTTYTPLRQLGAGPGKVVGVLGIGGLGHVGVKIAKAMGCEVVAITRSKSKEDEAKRFGASRLLVSSDEEAMKAAARSIDIILDTVAAPHDLHPMLSLLKVGGTMVQLGAPATPYTLSVWPLLNNNCSIMGSLIAGMPWTQDMLDFCGKHNITAEIELIKADYVNTAMDRLQASDVRYRFVIDIEKSLAGAE